MERFDLIVIGSGSRLEVSAGAAEQGWRVAVVEEGPFGGTLRRDLPQPWLHRLRDHRHGHADPGAASGSRTRIGSQSSAETLPTMTAASWRWTSTCARPCPESGPWVTSSGATSSSTTPTWRPRTSPTTCSIPTPWRPWITTPCRPPCSAPRRSEAWGSPSRGRRRAASPTCRPPLRTIRNPRRFSAATHRHRRVDARAGGGQLHALPSTGRCHRPVDLHPPGPPEVMQAAFDSVAQRVADAPDHHHDDEAHGEDEHGTGHS